MQLSEIDYLIMGVKKNRYPEFVHLPIEEKMDILISDGIVSRPVETIDREVFEKTDHEKEEIKFLKKEYRAAMRRKFPGFKNKEQGNRKYIENHILVN